MSSELKTVAAVQDGTSAEFYESLLEENGIPAYIPGKYTIALQNPGFWVTLGTVGIQVPAEYETRAREILQELEELEVSEPSSIERPLDMPSVIPENSYKRWFYLGWFAITTFGFYLFHIAIAPAVSGFLLWFLLFCVYVVVASIVGYAVYLFHEQQLARRNQLEVQESELAPSELSEYEPIEETPQDLSGIWLLLRLVLFAVAAIVAVYVYEILFSL